MGDDTPTRGHTDLEETGVLPEPPVSGSAHLALLHQMSSIAVSSLDAVRIAQQAADAIHAHFSTLFVAVRLANRERSRLRIVALRGLPDEYFTAAGILPVTAEHLVCEVFRTGRPVYGDEISSHPQGAALADDLSSHGVHPGSHLVLPLKGRNSNVGVLTLGWTGPRSFTGSDVESFSSLANILAAGIENGYLYEDERGAAEIARRLSDASQRLASEFASIFDSLTDAVIVLDSSAMITRSNPSAKALFGFDPVGVSLSLLVERAGICDSDGVPPRPHKAPCRIALAGEVACDVAFTLDRDGHRIQVLVSASPIVTDGVVTAAVSVWRDTSERESLIETLASERKRVEDILASITDGFAVVDRAGVFRSANASFTTMFGLSEESLAGTHLSRILDENRGADILHALEAAFAEESSSALVQYYAPTDMWAETRVYPAPDGATIFVTDVSTRRKADLEREALLSAYRVELARTSLLKDIAATAGSSLSIEQVCGRVVDTIRAHLSPAQGMLHLYEESGDALVLASYFGIPTATISSIGRIPADDSSAPGRLIVRDAPYVTHDTPDVGWPDEERADTVRWIVVPVVSAGQPLATLALAFEKRRAFSGDEVSLFRSIAGQLAVALDNARLYQREHRIADTLQRSLLAESSRVRGIEVGRVYRSATEHVRVGGDFYDVYPLPDGQAGVTIGDVSGKGLQAASVTALVRNTLRAYALDGLEPHEVVGRANEVLCYFSDREVFATATFATLDSQNGTLRYCNGGHPSPLILRDGGEVAVLDQSDAMLGAMEGLGYRTAHDRLGPGDTLILYTDGVTEARNGNVFFGEERLVELLPSLAGMPTGTIATAIADTASEFGGGVLRDDVAVVTIRLTQTDLT